MSSVNLSNLWGQSSRKGFLRPSIAKNRPTPNITSMPPDGLQSSATPCLLHFHSPLHPSCPSYLLNIPYTLPPTSGGKNKPITTEVIGNTFEQHSINIITKKTRKSPVKATLTFTSTSVEIPYCPHTMILGPGLHLWVTMSVRDVIFFLKLVPIQA